MSALLVFIGGGLGAVLRHLVGLTAARMFPGFPWGTLVVNIVGGVAMGLLAASLATREPMRLFLLTGILGGFTTFSAFSLDAVLLWENGRTLAAVGYVAGSVVFAIGGLAFGLQMARGALS